MRKFGLVGRNISYSFSRKFFSEKFEREGIAAVYENFDLEDIKEFPEVIINNPELKGLNVTIPYKETILPFLDNLDPIAEEIGAVNTIKVSGDGQLTGYNTDYFGFTEALKPHLKPHHQNAFILGTGGASKAIDYALRSLNINTRFVSRSPSKNAISYEDLSKENLATHTVIVNTTPLGTYPKIEEFPALPVQHLNTQHLLFDLIYNPSKTALMQLAESGGATVLNGQKMLELQALKAWEIWIRG
ncbi:shikimate dehydrogenase family protein [Salinimicrobium sediminilitoris]|uniref:shikimate dehydrogenase family protein n=1 Tax=Salinimicrobium sediminilitoris TaxID=2876715 RepID=UPI001E341E25|nr:shikimate dehydrogenase [Salinimicrobium sediminilitoris]MCC8361441.1 shikimate dehydrogenase [Salinimicrobium sediminilitoris]